MDSKILVCFFFFLPAFLYSQNAFFDAKDIIEYEDLLERDDLKELMDIYIERTDFEPESKNTILETLKFIEDPFREDFNYESSFTSSFIYLDDLIDINYDWKERIKPIDYHLLLECDDGYPETYETFLDDDKVVLVDSSWNCYIEKYKEKYPPEFQVDSDADGVVDFLDVEPGIAVDNPLSPTTKIVDATSQFLVDRVKEELLLAFFDRFLARIDESPELTALMPNTYFLLKNNDVFKVPSMGEVWITAFEEDLNALASNFNNMVRTHPDYLVLKEKPLIQLFMIGGFVYENLEKEPNVEELVTMIYDEFSDTETFFIQMLGFVGLVRDNISFRNTNSPISLNSYRELMKQSDNAPLYFTALVYQQEKDFFKNLKIPYRSATSNFADLMKANYVGFSKKAGQFLNRLDQLKNSAKEFEDSKYLKTTDKEKYQEALVAYSKSIFDFLDYSIELAYFVSPNDYYTSDYFNSYRPLAIKAIETFDAGLKKDYGQLMIHTMQLMEPIINLRISYLEKKYEETKDEKLPKQIRILNGVVKNFVYYGGFMVDVLSAESTEDIKNIIYKYAAPVGSYRVKRQSQFSASLSAYCGLYGGWESTEQEGETTNFVTGVTAPIGLSLDWGNQFLFWEKRNHTTGLFFPIVDIGAAFSYRWTNSEAEGFPEEIKWQQILSPGAYVIWGIGKSPLALNLGVQYTPQLRKITDQNNELEANAWRVGAGLTVDIPIFYFHKSTKYQ